MAQQTTKKTKTPAPKESAWPPFWNPTGYLLLLIALIVDGIGVVTVIISVVSGGALEFIDWIPDIMGMATIGAYELFKMGQMPLGKKIKKFTIGKGKKLKWLELVPWLGFAPFWTVYVYRNMRNKK